jgi:hypothetical protein
VFVITTFLVVSDPFWLLPDTDYSETMKRVSPADRPPPTAPVDPIFDLQTVRPRRPASSAWITVEDDDLIDDESGAIAAGPSRARRIVVRIVGYLLIAALFWGTARLVARRPIRDAILDWTTFGLTESVRSAEKRIADFVSRWRTH